MNKSITRKRDKICDCSSMASSSASDNCLKQKQYHNKESLHQKQHKSFIERFKERNESEINCFDTGQQQNNIKKEQIFLNNNLILNKSSSISKRPIKLISSKLSLYLPFSLIIFQLSFTFVLSDKCFVFGPGMTILGGDYRRDYGVKKQVCAETCKYDVCCMGFEYQENEGICTLKSRSLNGSVTTAGDDTYLGLCVDFTDPDRNRFWDHEMYGPSIAIFEEISRFKCAQMCAEKQKSDTFVVKSPKLRFARNLSRRPLPPISYSWKNSNPMDADFELGTCSCIKVLESIRLSFGSFAGFLPST